MTRAELEQYVVERIYPNNAQEITGASLQDVLLKIVENSENKEEATATIAQLIADISTKVSQEVFDTTIASLSKAIETKATSVDVEEAITRNEEAITRNEEAIADIITNSPIVLGEGESSAKQFGLGNTASGKQAFASGRNTVASGELSHTEGYATQALKRTAHAEGRACIAANTNSHAEGDTTQANGMSSHAEGRETQANGDYSHAGGRGAQADGDYSHALGYKVTTRNAGELACGRLNKTSQNTLFSVGFGTSEDQRHNAFEVRDDGSGYLGERRIMTETEYSELLERIEALE